MRHTGRVRATGVVEQVSGDSAALSAPLVVAAVVVGCVIFTRVTGFVVRRVVRHLASRGLTDASRVWRVRHRRTGAESSAVGEQRRRQRIDAASRMINHLISVVVWIGATIAAFHILDIDAAFFLSSAGFLGAAIAIGGSQKVNDYLTGLAVHFEDRYGVGDEIVVEVGWEHPVHAVVDHVGLFSTRLRDSRSTMHFPNGSLSQVRNLSQEASVATLQLHIDDKERVDDVADALRGLAGGEHLTDVVFLGDIEAHAPNTGEVEVSVTTLRPLEHREKALLQQRAERVLGKFER